MLDQYFLLQGARSADMTEPGLGVVATDNGPPTPGTPNSQVAVVVGASLRPASLIDRSEDGTDDNGTGNKIRRTDKKGKGRTRVPLLQVKEEPVVEGANSSSIRASRAPRPALPVSHDVDNVPMADNGIGGADRRYEFQCSCRR